MLRPIRRAAFGTTQAGSSPASCPARKLPSFTGYWIATRRAPGRRRNRPDIVRLLLLTGCRKNEIVCLRREEVKGNRLELSDSKTGPRTVLLNARAQEIVERCMAEGCGPWVFPSPRNPSRHQWHGLPLWYRIRCEAGIEDVRLHDLRHTVASQAVLNGVPLTVAASLLGHSDVRMTMRYAHVGDREVETAAERVGLAIEALIGRKRSHRPNNDGSANLSDSDH